MIGFMMIIYLPLFILSIVFLIKAIKKKNYAGAIIYAVLMAVTGFRVFQGFYDLTFPSDLNDFDNSVD